MTVTINGTTGIAGVDGSAATPAVQGGDANTGIFYGTDIVAISTGGTERMRVNASGQAEFTAGTAALPAITATGNTNTGIFFSAADTIDFTEGGVATGQFDSSGNFKFNSGYGSVVTAYGCRAWVNFDGTTNTGGFCTIRASGNVTSVTDNGVGQYTVNLTTAMPDTNYCVVKQDSNRGVGESNVATTSTYSIVCRQNTTDTTVDVGTIFSAIFR
jgi:hypothetical protein